MKLVIVESPTKCKTIGQYLGEEYKVMASIGHIRDLSTSGPGGLGVAVYEKFKPTYVVAKDKADVIKSLKNAANKADEVLLATDPDREGEAIAWHLAEVLNLNVENTKRLEFHEITKPALMKAIVNPRTIDMNLVASQETRRIMDRIIGFKLSYLLQKKIKSRSAGRVQSVTLKFIVDREKEILAFEPEEYWSIEGVFGEDNIKADLTSFNGKPIKISDLESAEAAMKAFPEVFDIESYATLQKSKETKPAFTTSTLQQEAFNHFHYSTKKTALLAQHLYEGIEIDGNLTGLITYMRTDSTRLSPEFATAAKHYIKDNYGEKYVGTIHLAKNKQKVQDAHEAIRPTDLSLTPSKVKEFLPRDEYNIYRLIYARTLASMMTPRVDEVTTLKLLGNGYQFKAEASALLFDGFDVIYKEFDSNAKDTTMPDFADIKSLKLISAIKEQHFTKAPSRFTEARVVKVMEEKGIGRPSTYSSTISTLTLRQYVTSVKGTLTPSDQGILTVDELVKFFPNFMDPSYTAEMENRLDSIVAGDASRVDLLEGFYSDFVVQLEKADENMVKILPPTTGENCPECGSPLVLRKGRYGEFVACSSYPTCNYIKKENKEIEYAQGKACPDCGKPLVKRTSKSGQSFYGCSGFPKCRYIENIDAPTVEKDIVDIESLPLCPQCNTGHLVEKKSRFGSFMGCSNYPKCKYIEKIAKKKKSEEKVEEKTEDDQS